MKKILHALRKKYKEALNEIKDLQREHETQREDYLDMIRQQEREQKLFTGLVKMLMTDDEIERIKGACEWNEGN